MNPQINAPHQTGLLESSPANQRTYNFGVNTLTQIGLGGMAYGHIKREGTLPFNDRGYIKDDEMKYALGIAGSSPLAARPQIDIVDNNRLAYLWNTKMAEAPVQEEGGFGSTLVGGILSAVGDTISEVLNFLGGKGSMLYDYSSGPGSTLGLGRTFIGRYTDTGTVKNSYVSSYDYSLNTKNYQSNANNPESSGAPTWTDSLIHGREAKYGIGTPGKSKKIIVNIKP